LQLLNVYFTALKNKIEKMIKITSVKQFSELFTQRNKND
jgi:hypothetical protein